MIIKKIKNMKKGWFIGNFKPTVLKTKKFEVALHEHRAGRLKKSHDHFHKIATEYNVLVSGKMMIGNKIINKGDIFIIKPYEVSKDVVFLKKTSLICVKVPSIPTDKYKYKAK